MHSACCGCPAGIDGRCNHVTASLFALENYSKIKENKDVNNDLPCTSMPCKWNIPWQVRVEPMPVRHVKFVKHEYGKDKKRKLPCTDGPVPKRPIDKDRLSNILKEVNRVEQEIGKIIGLSHILPQDIPFPSVKPSTPNIGVSESLSIEKEWSLTSPLRMGPLSLHEIKEKAERTKRRLFQSSGFQKEIEIKTKEQHQSSLWHSIRQHRITASNAKRCMIKDTTSPTKAIASTLKYHGNIQTRAMKQGIEWESKIISRYEYVSGNSVSKSGFVISTTHPFLGASPDGRIHNGQGIIEVKKVISKDGESFEDTLLRLNIYKKMQGMLIINTNHKYHVQIQQQLFCTGTHYCHFIISDGVWMHIDIIFFTWILE